MSVEEILLTGSSELGLSLSELQLKQLATYLESLKYWNTKINLTSVRDDKEIAIKHFLDSITIAPFISDSSTVLDIGSGAGFPGIPLRILNPTLKVTPIESTEKKVFFMKHVIRELELEGITAVCGRAGDEVEGLGGLRFDCVVTRSVGSIRCVVELAVPYLDAGGSVVLMRGKRGVKEWEEAKDKVTEGFDLSELRELSLPFGGGQRVILVLERKG